MSKLWTVGAAALVLASALSACGATGDETEPGSTAAATPSLDVAQHQSGPESPIAFGLQVPKGATQLGPLVRIRSDRLIKAYTPQLTAALAQKEADLAAQNAELTKDGEPTITPTPAALNRPNTDTFKLLKDDAPKPDTTMSIMRVDGNPSDVVTRMISQIAAVIPNAGIKTRDLPTYCTSVEDRVTGCHLIATGTTETNRDLRITLTADPGDVKNRTAPPSTNTKPVMTLEVEYIGDPIAGQITNKNDVNVKLPGQDSNARPSSLIWPKMDLDAPSTVALLDGKWRAPLDTTILLAGFNPDFVALTTDKGRQADLITEEFIRSVSDKGKFTKDVVDDLNEVSTTYTAIRKDGKRAFATYVLSARGNYAMMFYLPALPR